MLLKMTNPKILEKIRKFLDESEVKYCEIHHERIVRRVVYRRP